MKWKTILFSLFLSSSALAQQVTVGSWNIEWLGTPDRRGGNARTAEQLEAVAARLADELDIEVAVLEEINTSSPQWSTLRARLEQRGYGLVEGGGGDQRIVIAFDQDEVQLTGSFEANLQSEFRRQNCVAEGRQPLLATLRSGNFDFTVVGVHLKSGVVPQGCQDDSFPEWVRSQQAQQIVAEIQRGWSEQRIDADVILAGDFNGGFGDGGLEAFRQAGYSILTEERRRSDASGTLSFRKGRFRSALDHLAVPASTVREWVPLSTAYWPALSSMGENELAAYHRAYSDHAPVWADFNTALADDDGVGEAPVSTVVLEPRCRCFCAEYEVFVRVSVETCRQASGYACEIGPGTQGRLAQCEPVATNRGN